MQSNQPDPIRVEIKAPSGYSGPTPQYSFVFDKAKDSWVCSAHGEVDDVGWVPCWAGCDEGLFDEYEDDPINEDPGTFSPCPECRGKGGWKVCGQCNANNPDVEY